MVWPVRARQGSLVAARQGVVCGVRHGLAGQSRCGPARPGPARSCSAAVVRPVLAWNGVSRFCLAVVAGRILAGHGEARYNEVRQSMLVGACHGAASSGQAVRVRLGTDGTSWFGPVWLSWRVSLWFGALRRFLVRQSMWGAARRGVVWNGPAVQAGIVEVSPGLSRPSRRGAPGRV